MRRRNQVSKTSGVALIVTLAMLTLLVFVIVAFFTRAMNNRQVDAASAGGARAEILAKSAAEFIVADLKAEIVAGSTAATSPSLAPVYRPLAPINATPALSRASGIAAGDVSFLSLVKQSTGAFFSVGVSYPNANPLIQADTGVTTATPSANRRQVSPARWNAPQMTTGGGFTNGDQIPRWVLMTRDGIPLSQSWNAGLKNQEAGNGSAAIGRFAFNIYDEGGLIDINVAGFPETLPVAAVGRKGTLGLAQIALVPGIDSAANAQKFVAGWRNLASGSRADNYLAYLGIPKNGPTSLIGNPFFADGPSNGFLKMASESGVSDNLVLGRQDLIRLAGKNVYGISPDSLPYLTHFTRELNAPGWWPVRDASELGGVDGTGIPAPFAYAANAENPGVANRFFPNVRVETNAGWRRLSGEKSKQGESLAKYRFPLSRLIVLQDGNHLTRTWDLSPHALLILNRLEARRLANGAGSLGGTPEIQAAALVQASFGLVWDAANALWRYAGPSGSTVQGTIKSLAQVAAENREPNFVELLKAGILAGSLGNSSDFESLSANVGEDASPDNQIIQIAANIIDQSDSDSFPTRIAFGKEMDSPASVISALSSSNAPTPTTEDKVFAGVEDIPYLQSVVLTPYRLPSGMANLGASPIDATQNAPRDYINCWAQFVLWKPQQESLTAIAPGSFRVLYSGAGVQMKYPASPAVEYPIGSGIRYGNTVASGAFPARFTDPPTPGGTVIEFGDAPSSFRVPSLLTTGTCSQPHGNNPLFPRGMWMGETYRPQKLNNPTLNRTTAPDRNWVEFEFSNDSRLELQFRDGSGAWRTYQRYDRVGMGSLTSFRSRGKYGLAINPNGAEAGPAGNRPLAGDGFDTPAFSVLDVSALAISAADPRTQRFGLMAMYIYNFAPNTLPPASALPDLNAARNAFKQGWQPDAGGGSAYRALFYPSNVRFTPSWGSATATNPWSGLGTAIAITDPTSFWVDNPGSGSFYKDPDGIARRADGDSANNVRPMQMANPTTANSAALGVILNRPFRSVGELACTFRDSPWKSLDFFTSNSADGALLDIFSVDEQPDVVAGKLNLNTRNPLPLQTILVAASRDESDPANTISAAEAQALAEAMVNNTSDTSGAPETGPMRNPGELASRLSKLLAVSNSPNAAIKSRREVIGRALAGSGQTRTWNLLIDVIAQSGRFSATATNLEQFAVEGEKRYWLHVAIDRHTGQVIDQQLEPVFE